MINPIKKRNIFSRCEISRVNSFFKYHNFVCGKMAKENVKMREKEKFIVEYEKELYDITDFMHKHPGKIATR